MTDEWVRLLLPAGLLIRVALRSLPAARAPNWKGGFCYDREGHLYVRRRMGFRHPQLFCFFCLFFKKYIKIKSWVWNVYRPTAAICRHVAVSCVVISSAFVQLFAGRQRIDARFRFAGQTEVVASLQANFASNNRRRVGCCRRCRLAWFIRIAFAAGVDRSRLTLRLNGSFGRRLFLAASGEPDAILLLLLLYTAEQEEGVYLEMTDVPLELLPWTARDFFRWPTHVWRMRSTPALICSLNKSPSCRTSSPFVCCSLACRSDSAAHRFSSVWPARMVSPKASTERARPLTPASLPLQHSSKAATSSRSSLSSRRATELELAILSSWVNTLSSVSNLLLALLTGCSIRRHNLTNDLSAWAPPSPAEDGPADG